MAVPTSITELSTTANSNPPSGSESTAEGDQQIRAAYSFIAQNYAEKAPKASPTFTGVPAAPTAAVDTNTTQIATTAFVMGQAYSGTYSPTFTDVTNVTNSGTWQHQYMRVGSVVTVSGRVELTPTATGATLLRISLPIASTISVEQNVGGAGGSTANGGRIFGDVVNNAAYLQWTANDTVQRTWGYSFTYLVS